MTRECEGTTHRWELPFGFEDRCQCGKMVAKGVVDIWLDYMTSGEFAMYGGGILSGMWFGTDIRNARTKDDIRLDVIASLSDGAWHYALDIARENDLKLLQVRDALDDLQREKLVTCQNDESSFDPTKRRPMRFRYRWTGGWDGP